MLRELRPMLRLALPVIVAEIGWISMGIVDTIMVGPIGPAAIGAVGTGSTMFFAVMVFGMGTLYALDTFVSRSFGANRIDECHRWLFAGFQLAAVMSVLLVTVALAGVALLPRAHLHPDVIVILQPYLGALLWSAPPLLAFTVLRRYLQAMNAVRPIMVVLVTANLVNAGANWMLVYGHFGSPAFGVIGSAYATVAARTYLALGLLVVVLRRERARPSGLHDVPFEIERARVASLLKLGLPAAAQIALEVGVFAAASGLAARITPMALAANQVVLNVASFFFMIPLGLSSAAAVRVGQAIGRHDPQGVRLAGGTALGVSLVVTLCLSLAFIVAPNLFLGVFTRDTSVLEVGAVVLFAYAVAQPFDGFQVVATGALRGLGDTRTPMIFNLVGHWLIGLPVAYYLCFTRGWGVLGLWTGLGMGLTLIGALLLGTWWVMKHAGAVMDDRFRIFARLFAVAVMAYHAQFSHPIGVTLHSSTLVAALVLLARPASVSIFLSVNLIQVIAAYRELPDTDTNRLLLFFAGVTILAAALGEIWSQRRLAIERGRLIARIEPLLRAEVVIVYAFSAFHKLNTGFLDAQLSCGATLFNRLAAAFPPASVLPHAIVAPLASYGTLATEFAMAAGLVWPTTRRVAVILGWSFHYVLGIGGFFRFSMTMIALLFLFTPSTFQPRLPHMTRRLAWIGAGLAVVVIFGLWRFDRSAEDSLSAVRMITFPQVARWLFWIAIVPIARASSRLLRTRADPRPTRLVRGDYSWAWSAFPLLVFTNGLSPYLGLKTETSFAMYSNLRTEGGVTNHLVVRRPLYVADYQSDLVTIVESSDPELARAAAEKRPIPFVELRRVVQKDGLARPRPLSLTYMRDGVSHAVQGVDSDPALRTPLSYLEWKLLRFREIRPECAH